MKLSNKAILFLILVIAALLRFWNYGSLPFTHDEFSAIFRLDFNSFSKLIREGVMPDGHPAGIQVFLFYWTKLFGFTEWIVKLPFTILGILAVYLSYLTARKWFSETSALLIAALLTVIQFTVAYSQIARPYISGHFFSLLMVYYWTGLIKEPDKDFMKKGSLFVISILLCAYNHYFSLLFAGIVGLSGLFFLKREYLLKYTGLGLAAFILYIPHLKIFIYQLSLGGIEAWLAKPGPYFLPELVYYIFNYSPVLIFTVLGILIWAWKFQRENQNKKTYLLFASWFLFPIIIGYLYSVKLNAVLQFSGMIFSFVFLLFILLAHIRNLSPRLNLLLVSLVLITGITSLVFERQHYKLFYNSVYENIMLDYREARETDSESLFIIDSRKKISTYYSRKHNIDTCFSWYDFESPKNFKAYLKKESGNHDKLFLGTTSSLPSVAIPILQEYYPSLEWQRDYFGGSTYLFSKWGKDKLYTRDGETGAYSLSADEEWGPVYSKSLKDMISNGNNYIDVSLRARSESELSEVILVCSVESGQKVLHWSGTDLGSYSPSDSSAQEWNTYYNSVNLSVVDQKHKDIEFKSYIWNKGGKEIETNGIQVNIRRGNPVIYGFTEKLLR